MAKSSKTEARLQEETRKQAVERRKYAEMNRRIWIGLAVVGVLIFGLLAAAVIQELVIKPRAPIAEVNGARISSAEYAKRVKFDWFQNQDQVSDPQGSSLQVLDQMVDEALIREQAQQRGITVTEEEVNERIEQFFGYQRVPPTPAPTATPDPSATPSTEPTATPFPTPTPVTLEAYQKELKDYVERLGSNTEMTEADFRSLVELSTCCARSSLTT